ncbi:MAG: substrate binding domain-containing protein, partial [Asticcacaulis sp.]
RAALTQLECAAETLSDAVTDLAGPIRITAPVTFGMRYLAPAFAEFVTLYPKIEMDARFEDVTVDLAGEGFDLGIRLGDLENSSLLVRLLGESRRMVVTSPAYLERHGPITRADDLTDCAILHYSSRRTIDIWRYRTSHGDGVVKVRPYQVANNTAQLMAWVKAGLGVTLMPVYVTEAMVRTGEAVPVLDHCDWGVTRVSALMPQGRGTPRRVRTLVDFLAARFKEGFAA